ncbi:MAG: FAD-dependent oxidoreductase [Candidatus Methylomirabilia bacterium]
MGTQVVVIGGGVAGLAGATSITRMGYDVTLIEREATVGGQVARWARVFPTGRRAEEIIDSLREGLDGVQALTESRVSGFAGDPGRFRLEVNGTQLEAAAILVAVGYQPFDPSVKEEYGYGVYPDVVSSVELEAMLKADRLRVPSTGAVPETVAINHCVGSRDEKVGNLYCSRVCCTYGIHQAVEIRERHPGTSVFCFYMDIRTYGRGFEELYRGAQKEFGVEFIRGRIADVQEEGHRLLIRAEDTLSSSPLRMHVDLLSLSVGMVPAQGAGKLGELLGLEFGEDGFFKVRDPHLHPNESTVPGIFLAGAASGPKGITESITDGRAAAAAIGGFLRGA